MKLMEEFQQETNKVKEEQIKSMQFFTEKKSESQNVARKYEGLSNTNHNNISQFVKSSDESDEYTEKLLERISQLEQ